MLKIRSIAALFKLRLASLVVISAVLGYFMGRSSIDWKIMTALCLGGFLLTGGSNGMNQVWEKRWDALMNRTRTRPIPTGKLSATEAAVISMIAGIAGIVMLWVMINPASGILGLCAFFMYVFVQTLFKLVLSHLNIEVKNCELES